MKRIALFVILAVSVAAGASAAATEAVPSKVGVNWDKGVYVAVAEARAKTTGAKSDPKLVAAAKLRAKEAVVSAILAALGSTPVDSFTKGENYLKHAGVRKDVSAFIVSRCLKYSVAKAGKATAVRAVAEVPIYRVFRLMVSSQETPWMAEKSGGSSKSLAEPEPEVDVQVSANKSAAEESPEPQVGPFTSLIVDTLGFNVQRAMSPKIRREDGSEVWGTVKVDPDVVLDSGIVAYTKSMEEARKNGRAGTNPLVVKAIGRAGGNFFCDAVVGDSDATLILDENAKTHFCDELKVIFVVDPKP